MGRGFEEIGKRQSKSFIQESGRVDINSKVKFEEEPDHLQKKSDQEESAKPEDALKQEQAAWEEKKRKRRRARRSAARKVLSDYGIADFSKGSIAEQALDSRGYLEDDYLKEVREVKDHFLRAQGETHLWRLYKQDPWSSARYILSSGASMSAEEAQQSADKARQAQIEEKIALLQQKIREQTEARRRGSDLSGLSLPYGFREDHFHHIQRTSLPGNYDVVSYVAKKHLYDKKGHIKQTYINLNTVYRKRLGILIFKNGNLLPIADASKNDFLASFDDDDDRLGIERFFPRTLHRRALAIAKDMIRAYIIEEER